MTSPTLAPISSSADASAPEVGRGRSASPGATPIGHARSPTLRPDDRMSPKVSSRDASPARPGEITLSQPTAAAAATSAATPIQAEQAGRLLSSLVEKVDAALKKPAAQREAACERVANAVSKLSANHEATMGQGASALAIMLEPHTPEKRSGRDLPSWDNRLKQAIEAIEGRLVDLDPDQGLANALKEVLALAQERLETQPQVPAFDTIFKLIGQVSSVFRGLPAEKLATVMALRAQNLPEGPVSECRDLLARMLKRYGDADQTVSQDDPVGSQMEAEFAQIDARMRDHEVSKMLGHAIGTCHNLACDLAIQATTLFARKTFAAYHGECKTLGTKFQYKKNPHEALNKGLDALEPSLNRLPGNAQTHEALLDRIVHTANPVIVTRSLAAKMEIHMNLARVQSQIVQAHALTLDTIVGPLGKRDLEQKTLELCKWARQHVDALTECAVTAVTAHSATAKQEPQRRIDRMEVAEGVMGIFGHALGEAAVDIRNVLAEVKEAKEFPLKPRAVNALESMASTLGEMRKLLDDAVDLHYEPAERRNEDYRQDVEAFVKTLPRPLPRPLALPQRETPARSAAEPSTADADVGAAGSALVSLEATLAGLGNLLAETKALVAPDTTVRGARARVQGQRPQSAPAEETSRVLAEVNALAEMAQAQVDNPGDWPVSTTTVVRTTDAAIDALFRHESMLRDRAASLPSREGDGGGTSALEEFSANVRTTLLDQADQVTRKMEDLIDKREGLKATHTETLRQRGIVHEYGEVMPWHARVESTPRHVHDWWVETT